MAVGRRAPAGMTTRKHIRHLGRRWLPLREAPDLDIVVARFAPRRSAIFRAGLELSFMHLGLAPARPCGAYRPYVADTIRAHFPDLGIVNKTAIATLKRQA